MELTPELNFEIERKFLLKCLPPKYLFMKVDSIKQAYLLEGEVGGFPYATRVRIVNEQVAYLTHKIATDDASVRVEHEEEISLSLALALFEVSPNRVHKNRYTMPKGLGDEYEITIDEFIYPEFPSLVEIEGINFHELPHYCGEEVTSDPKYQNSNIAKIYTQL